MSDFTGSIVGPSEEFIIEYKARANSGPYKHDQHIFGSFSETIMFDPESAEIYIIFNKHRTRNQFPEFIFYTIVIKSEVGRHCNNAGKWINTSGYSQAYGQYLSLIYSGFSNNVKYSLRQTLYICISAAAGHSGFLESFDYPLLRIYEG